MEAEVKRVLSLLREMEKTMNSVNTSKLSQEEKEIVDREISLIQERPTNDGRLLESYC